MLRRLFTGEAFYPDFSDSANGIVVTIAHILFIVQSVLGSHFF